MPDSRAGRFSGRFFRTHCSDRHHSAVTRAAPLTDKRDPMFDPCSGHWQIHRWGIAHSRRYYEVRVLKNLPGDWEIFYVWGGLGSRLGGTLASTTLSLAGTAGTLS